MPTNTPNQHAQVAELFGNRLRTRVCGLYREGDSILMVKHTGVGPSGTFWAPPGGGIEFGETAHAALSREMLEETGLIIDVKRLICVSEFVAPPLHAIELFFDVQHVGGALQLGTDPEMEKNNQLIQEVRLMTIEQIKALPTDDVHRLFSRCESISDVFNLAGYII